jgi:hypothetical protein
MQAIEILDTVSASGGLLWLEGDKVRARLPESLRPLVSAIRARKPEIIELLAQRPVMPEGIRLVSYRPKEPPVKLSPCETVTNVERFVQATLRQLEAKLCGASGWNYGWRSLPELLDRLAAVGCIVALDNPRKALQ